MSLKQQNREEKKNKFGFVGLCHDVLTLFKLLFGVCVCVIILRKKIKIEKITYEKKNNNNKSRLAMRNDR